MCNLSPLGGVILTVLGLLVGAGIALAGLYIGYQIRDSEYQEEQESKIR